MTDSIRAEIIEIMGYRVQVMEFIDMEHTPKNIMIRSVKTDREYNDEKLRNLEKVIAEYHLDPTLYRLVFKNK